MAKARRHMFLHSFIIMSRYTMPGPDCGKWIVHTMLTFGANELSHVKQVAKQHATNSRRYHGNRYRYVVKVVNLETPMVEFKA